MQIGGALGIAILVSVLSTRSGNMLSSGSSPAAAEAGGLQLAFLIGAGVAQAASLLAGLGLKKTMRERA